MTTYQLDIIIHRLNRADKAYKDCVQAANIIEMRQSEYFTWEDDAQESLSRSSAIKYAEEEIQSYHSLVRENLSYLISIKDEEVCCEGAEIVNDNGYSVCSLCGANLTTQREDYDE